MDVFTALAEADKVQRVTESHDARMSALKSAAQDARDGVLRALAALDYDQVAFDRALDRLYFADAAVNAEALKVVSESVATLTPAERRIVASQAVRYSRRH